MLLARASKPEAEEAYYLFCCILLQAMSNSPTLQNLQDETFDIVQLIWPVLRRKRGAVSPEMQQRGALGLDTPLHRVDEYGHLDLSVQASENKDIAYLSPVTMLSAKAPLASIFRSVFRPDALHAGEDPFQY